MTDGRAAGAGSRGGARIGPCVDPRTGPRVGPRVGRPVRACALIAPVAARARHRVQSAATGDGMPPYNRRRAG
ncbi:hypothetical protein AQ837_19915 [Burkholderia pseudomallei]|nr:hypothetical protein AQ819_14335 [Burkholderia pseudomallei]OMY02909.1 hypothetical protein AQ837_19915 [Burkholderia pseudomallei]OMY15526.1 hypothetical protein AQ838_03660 [Burkholderia pseudomallei]OMY19964.1 hypothetical protein AQ839_21515 [Burkholderia pseudomallei]OMY27824.1 hypothetical protein AQ840_02955 [Burkholderia pseudomallei]